MRASSPRRAIVTRSTQSQSLNSLCLGFDTRQMGEVPFPTCPGRASIEGVRASPRVDWGRHALDGDVRAL